LGAIVGKGVELVVTLGTGFGSALFVDGKLVPNLEMGHHEFRKEETYEQQLGRAALEKVGDSKWNRRLEKAIASLQSLFNYNYLYIGGGEAYKGNNSATRECQTHPKYYWVTRWNCFVARLRIVCGRDAMFLASVECWLLGIRHLSPLPHFPHSPPLTQSCERCREA
jgi:predicted NBD/HSP70 family sugar kinase